MAIVRKLTDGTTTVDLNDGTTFKLVRPFDLNVGPEGDDVTTVIRCVWVSTVSTDSRAVKRRTIQQLLNKARKRRTLARPEDWVWLEVQSEDEANARYAIVKGGIVASATSNEQDDKQDFLRISLTRESEWLNAAPTGSGTASVNGTTIYNKSDTIATSGDNWVTIADLDGDAPAIMQIITEVTNNGVKTLKIGGKYGTTTHLNGFNPWFNVADLALLGGGSQVADAAAPDDERLEISSDGVPQWNISASDLDHYEGRYRVFAYMKQFSGGGSATASVYHGAQTAGLETVDVSSASLMHDLGTITVPDFPLVASSKPTAGNYPFKLDIDITGTATIYVYALALIPLDLSYFIESPNGLTGSNTQWTVDGYTKRTYLANNSGDQLQGFPLVASGRFPKMRAADDGNLRLYFFGDQETTTPTFNDTMDITVRTKSSYLTTRGAGS